MNRRTFIKASAGALGISTLGYYRDRIPIRFTDDITTDDIHVTDVSLVGEVQVEFTVENLVNEPVDVSPVVVLYEEGEILNRVSWSTVTVEPKGVEQVSGDVGSESVWYADSVEIEIAEAKHTERLI